MDHLDIFLTGAKPEAIAAVRELVAAAKAWSDGYNMANELKPFDPPPPSPQEIVRDHILKLGWKPANPEHKGNTGCLFIGYPVDQYYEPPEEK